MKRFSGAIKKIASLAMTALVAFGAAGCSVLGSEESSSAGDGYGSVSISFSHARAVSYDSYSDITLFYKASGASGFTKAASWASESELSAVSIPVGVYTFKLTATVAMSDSELGLSESAAMSGEASAAIENGKTTEISFTLKRSDSSSDDSNLDVDTDADVTNATVKIVKSEGWLNSAYVVFNQISGATYTVKVDGTQIDNELIRFYDTYNYYEKSEDSNLAVSYSKKTLSNVVRADALGLAAGSHTISVSVDGGKTESTATMTVLDNDRSGFAFTDGAVPGAYSLDGTLKNGAVVIYLTEENKKTVTATIGGKEYTGIADITQAIKTKNTGTTPVDIRIIGKLTLDGLSCSDMSSAYALGVKEANYVTIEGVGDDATMVAGVAAFTSDYIEIKNLGLMKWGGGKDGDGVSLKKSTYVWVHNNDFFYGDAGSDADQVKGDGSMDLKDNSQHVTISYNHFWDSGKMSLCGMKSESAPNYITYHHNWFDHSDSRHPRIRTMSVHVYNNYFDGNAKYGVGVTSGGNAFVEGNFFRNAHDPMMISKQGTDARGSGTFSGEEGGGIKSYNNKFEQNNTNGVSFQFITNKYDYTNNQELGEYKEWTETIGTENSDGTWTIYDSAVTDSTDTIASNSLIAIEDAAKKGAYYQGSKGKTMFYLDVPANTTKVVLKAKTGSSTSGATTTVSVDGTKSNSISNTSYTDVEIAVSVTKDSTIAVVNSGSNSLNISEIKVIASTGWKTTLSSGADMSNIDAYEVDERSETVPATVLSKSGNHAYSNFDTTLGDAGLGLTNLPTSPDVAKASVLEFAGRHNPDFAWNFDNSIDDASYAVNEELNSALLAHTTGVTKIRRAFVWRSFFCVFFNLYFSKKNAGDLQTISITSIFPRFYVKCFL